MEVKFVAYDGKVFDDAAKCVEYEAEHTEQPTAWAPKAWGRTGTPLVECDHPDDPDSVMFVYLENESEIENFVRWMREHGDNTDYSEFCEGWYYWDEWDECYRYAEVDVMKVLAKLMEENK